MTSLDLKSVRRRRGWNQQQLADHLGVSQTLVSLWEKGNRPVPSKRMARLRKLGVKVDPASLPMRDEAKSRELDFAQELANLGYPGFAHFRGGHPNWNPAQLLVLALSQNHLDRRVAEALPWLVLQYPEMNWEWVRREAKLRDLQNRLGFTVALARKLASEKKQLVVAQQLEEQERALRDSMLAKQDTYCNDDMTDAERKWLQKRRSPDAAAWNVLSNLEAAQPTHA